MASPRVIIGVVSEFRSVEPDQLAASSRQRNFAWPRQETCWLMRKRTRLSLPAIGRILGGRDHTTIAAAVHAVERRAAADPDYREDLAEMLSMVDAFTAAQGKAAAGPVTDTAVATVRQAGGVSNADAMRLATTILTLAAITRNALLNDREARGAVRAVLSQGGALVDG